MVFLGIDALGFNLPALIAQLINFTLLLIIFRLLLYKPLLNILDQRKQRPGIVPVARHAGIVESLK